MKKFPPNESLCIIESIIDNANEKSDKAQEKNEKSKEEWKISMMGKCETFRFYYSKIHEKVRENMIRAIKFLRG